MPQPGTTVSTLVSYLDSFCQTATAAEWDNVGLLMGDGSADVNRVLTCLTVTPEVVAEAIEQGVQLIVSHHPVLFKATKRLVASSGDGKLLWPLARAGVAVYSPHTGFDNAPGGINDSLAKTLGLTAIQPLRKRANAPSFKIVVFVPDSDLTRVSEAMFQAGAGIIGQYEQCSYRLNGTGTFFGTESTNPVVGQKGQREEVAEWRLEVVCPQRALPDALSAMRKAHSYEEPAFDVYPLHALPSPQGEGRVGLLPEPIPLQSLAEQIKEKLKSGRVQIIGSLEKPIQKIALACGAAGEFLSDAIRQKADLFLSGEMRFHDYLLAQASGIALVLPGHYATERPAVEELAARLQRDFSQLTVWPSRAEKDPVAWV